MRNLITVFRKEVAGFFHRSHAYMFIGVYFFLCSFFFNQALKRFTQGMLNLIRQNPKMLDMINLNDHLFEPFSYTMGVILLFVVLVLTMGAFAEERSKGTHELLMTSPVRLTELILGKYFAALFVFLLALALTGIFPLFLWIYGSMELAPILTAYFGLALAGAAFLAIGIFWSTVFESQVVAALVTFGNLLLFWLVGMADSGDSTFASDLARNLSAVLHLVGFTRGMIQLVDVVFYLTVVFFFLFLGHRALEWHRWGQGPGRRVTSFYGKFAGVAALPFLIAAGAIRYISAELVVIFWVVLAIGLVAAALFVILEMSWVKELFVRRSTFYGANTIVLSVIVAAVVVLLNVIVIWNPAKLDLTSDRLHTLNEKTINLVEGLEQEVKVVAFFQVEVPPEAKVQAVLKGLLDQYREHTGKLEYEFVDPNQNPALAKQYGITARSERIVIESGGKQARVERPTEEGLTNGLLQVAKTGGRAVCFTSGHGESDLAASDAGGFSQAKELLESDRYSVETLDLLHGGEDQAKIPDRCRVLAVAGPRYPFQAPEVKAIRNFLRAGGRALFLFEPDTNPGLDDVLAEYGIGLRADHVVDVGVRLQDASPYTVTAQNYAQHEITQGLGGFAFSKFPMARSLVKAEKAPPGTTVTELVKTTRRSFGETELTAEGPSYDPEKDHRGPLALAIAARKALPKVGDDNKEIRVIAFGDTDFAGNSHLHFMVNGSLFQNSVHWLAEATDLIAFPSKQRKGTTLFLTENQQNLILVSSVLLVPLAVILAGLFVRMARRGR